MDSRRRPESPARSSLSLSDDSLAQAVKEAALALGFDRVGIAPAAPTHHTERLRDWVASGYAGSMDYLTDRLEERVDPARVLEGARSVVMLGFVYSDGRDPGDGPDGFAGLDGSEGPEGRAGGSLPVQLARYAVGDDYHEVLLDRVRALGSAVEVLAGRAVASRAYVDTGPVAERALATRAGLGWIGKNSCLIDRELGSYLLLGALLLDIELPADEPAVDHCGSCRACLDACPTDAFAEPYVLDATRCIAYTTIEDPGPIPESLREGHGNWVFGCDVCQQVCPWNSRRGRPVLADPLGLRERLAPRADWQRPTLDWLLGLEEADWQRATRHSALRRTKRAGLLRNALVAAGNSGDRSLLPAVRRHAGGSDALIAEHARWALGRLEALGPGEA